MKILIYGINFSPELTGTGKYTGEMARWLSKAGHEVDVVTAPPYYPQWKVQLGYSAARYRREVISEDGATVNVLRCPLWVPSKVNGPSRLVHLLSFAASSMIGLVWGVMRKPDLVFVVAPTFFQVPGAVAVAKLWGVPAWLHVQDFEVDAALNMGMVAGSSSRRGVVRRLAWAAESFFMKRFDRVSSITIAMTRLLAQKGVIKDRIVLLPNWVSLQHIRPMPRDQSLRSELGFSDDVVVVLYSGNMGEKQGLELIVEAAALLKRNQDIRFVLAGTGSARDRMESASKALGNITWLPLQPFERLSALLATADVHLLPQRADAADLVMPSKLTGMLASGRAVVGTAAPDTQLGMVLDQVGLRVTPGDAKGLADAILRLGADPGLRDELGRLGRRYAEETLDQDAILRQFLVDVHALSVCSVQSKTVG